MSAPKLEFFFDCTSPWTYLAFDRIVGVSLRNGIDIDWRPILVGGVFNAVNAEIYDQRATPNPRKAAYFQKDLADWARYQGLRIVWPSRFPIKAVLAMRTVLAAQEQDHLVPFARAVFQDYWEFDHDIADPAVLAEIGDRQGLDGAALVDRAGSDAIKAQLRTNTQDLIARGGFGSPTTFVDGDDMYFGNDRLNLVEAAVQAGAGRPAAHG